jgi:hypothetical protein
MYLCGMIRKIIAYKNYYDDFMATLSVEVKKKIHYILDLLTTEDRISTKFVKHNKKWYI